MATHELDSILERLGLSRYLENCLRECIDDACLDTLEPDDVRELGFPIGPRRRFEAALAEWVALAAVIATPWWGDKLVGYLGLKRWWSARRKARDDGYVVVPTKAY